ncbi:hypothetical protein [Streptomyces lincolnensis]|uniref:hypothetical protein n=1 Tax=Streptomyces lincolnensis TaxID=1915 RepID=UPI0037D7FD12
MISYDGRRFRSTTHRPGAEAPVATYRQHGDLIWAEFAGGHVRQGSLTGIVAGDGDGVLDFTYTMVLSDGEVVAGRCRSIPHVLPDGRIRLAETWERYGERAAAGTSELEELTEPGPEPGVT